jgi:hypothetical protein
MSGGLVLLGFLLSPQAGKYLFINVLIFVIAM